MFHVALTPDNYPTNAPSAKAPSLIAALGDLFKALDVLELNEDCVSHVLEAAKEAVDNLNNGDDAKGTWTDMGADDDAFSIDIFCADDAKYVKFDDDLLLVPHGAIGLGVNKFNAQEWLYEEPVAGDWDDVLLPHVVYQPSEDGLDAAVRSVVEPPQITAIDREIKCGSCTLTALLNDGSTKRLFSFYVDELSFDDAELVGKTESEAHQLHLQRDAEYLRS